MRLHEIVGLVAACAGLAAPARAEVTDRSPSGFTVKVVADIAAPPARVYDALVRNVDKWWDKEHTYSGDAKNLSIDPKPGGCFCESLPAGGFVEHAVVINAQPGTLVRMRGALGPLQEAGVAGSLTWQFEQAVPGTKLTFTHTAGGYAPGGLDKLADIVDKVLAHQVAQLKLYAELVARQ